jgi:transposase
MAALSMDLRERILASYDRGEGTRDQIASRYKVSLGMVKKLIQQRRHSGDIAPRHHLSGRKPLILESHKKAMKELLARRPDMTLEELREATGLSCTLPAIHYALAAMGLTYKKRRSAPASRTAPTSSKPAGSGAGTKVVSIPQSLSSSTKAGRRPT